MSIAVCQSERAPRVVIAIVATDEIKNVIGCVNSLNNSNYRNFRIIICENSGQDAFDRDLDGLNQIGEVNPAPENANREDTRDNRQYFVFGADKRQIMILKAKENLGYSGGVNACIAAAGSDWDFIWVLNPDTFPEADALAALIRRQAQGSHGIVGSKIVFVSNGRIQLWGGLKWWPLIGRHRSIGFNQTSDTVPDVRFVEANLDVISGASMLVSKDYIERIGVMDEEFFVYYEDTEWSLRRGDFLLGYAHDSVVHHLAGATSGSAGPRQKRSRFSIYLTERNRVLLARKRYPLLWPIFALIWLLNTFEYVVRFPSLKSFGIALNGWWAGLTGETGMPHFMRGSYGRDAKEFLKRET
jgi:N-acetylglucosaminyl-diphospho-decaprenol L-rhamnosyltransferase